MKKRVLICFLLLILVLMLGGCQDPAKMDPSNNISVLRNGRIIYRIHEDFLEDYYSLDELKAMIIDEAAAYNIENGEDCIALSKLELLDGWVNVEMGFNSYRAFEDFGHGRLFVGSPGEALDAGYSLKFILTDVEDATCTISEPDIMALEGERLLISDSTETIYLPSKIHYASDNCIVSNDYRAVSIKPDEDGVFLIVY